MLSLVRKENQSLFIQPNADIDLSMTVAELFKNGAIEIYIHKIKNTQIRIAVGAPPELNIVRNELLTK